jgi:hypothetical protein
VFFAFIGDLLLRSHSHVNGFAQIDLFATTTDGKEITIRKDCVQIVGQRGKVRWRRITRKVKSKK